MLFLNNLASLRSIELVILSATLLVFCCDSHHNRCFRSSKKCPELNLPASFQLRMHTFSSKFFGVLVSVFFAISITKLLIQSLCKEMENFRTISSFRRSNFEVQLWKNIFVERSSGQPNQLFLGEF